MTIQEKLQQQPSLVKELNGRDYVPIGTVEQQLDNLQEDLPIGWSTTNWNIIYTSFPDGRMHISGSLTLYVDSTEYGASRPMVGAYSMFYDPHGGQFDLAGIVRSECIKNAATSLGIYFGRGLNGRLEGNEEVKKDAPVELPNEEATKKIASNLKM